MTTRTRLSIAALRRSQQAGPRIRPGRLLVGAALSLLVVLEAHPQAKPEPIPAAPARSDPPIRPSPDQPVSGTRIEESAQHGFFGDLSRPAPPALHRIDGIRLPEAEKPAPPRRPTTQSRPAPAAKTSDSVQGAVQTPVVEQPVKDAAAAAGAEKADRPADKAPQVE